MKSPSLLLRGQPEEAAAAAAASWQRLCLHQLRGGGGVVGKLPRHSCPEEPPRRSLRACGRLRRAEPKERAHVVVVGGGGGPRAGTPATEGQGRKAASAAGVAGMAAEEEEEEGQVFAGVYPPPGPPRHEACPSPRKRLVEPGGGGGAEGRALQQTRRLLANARERTRVHTISAAFEALRKQVPCYSYGQKLSKLAILRIACNYILSLARLADLDYSADHSNLSFSECVEQCTRTLQAEGRSKKRKGVVVKSVRLGSGWLRFGTALHWGSLLGDRGPAAPFQPIRRALSSRFRQA
uniref:Uncharacterized protein n=1 Tax=Sphaerodactylus townsendi TaxID=933632 RepID=A0ACB8FKE6_9SAUR